MESASAGRLEMDRGEAEAAEDVGADADVKERGLHGSS